MIVKENRTLHDLFNSHVTFAPGEYNQDESELMENFNNKNWTVLLIANRSNKSYLNNIDTLMLVYTLKINQKLKVHENPFFKAFFIQEKPTAKNVRIFKKFFIENIINMEMNSNNKIKTVNVYGY